jgi:hypothetical protein
MGSKENSTGEQVKSYYRGADKSLARPTSLSIVFSVQVTGGCPTGQIRRVGWVTKTLEAQVGQFLLGCKCPLSRLTRFLPGRVKDLSAPLYVYPQCCYMHSYTQ